MSLSPAISIEGLSFRYPGRRENCLNDLNLKVEQGERFGLFGPNGAGKTTLLHLLTSIIRFREGTISYFGEPFRASSVQKRKLGFVPQEYAFYEDLTPVENLYFFAAQYGLSLRESKSRAEELLDVMGLKKVSGIRVREFSGGMKRRLNLAIGVIHQPVILILDEPTVGVDVQTRHSIIEYLLELNSRGTTLVYTSHQLYEAEKLCNRVALMDEGRILVHDNLDDIAGNEKANRLEALFLSLTGKALRDG